MLELIALISAAAVSFLFGIYTGTNTKVKSYQLERSDAPEGVRLANGRLGLCDRGVFLGKSQLPDFSYDKDLDICGKSLSPENLRLAKKIMEVTSHKAVARRAERELLSEIKRMKKEKAINTDFLENWE